MAVHTELGRMMDKINAVKIYTKGRKIPPLLEQFMQRCTRVGKQHLAHR
jgi:hypothetical protein